MCRRRLVPAEASRQDLREPSQPAAQGERHWERGPSRGETVPPDPPERRDWTGLQGLSAQRRSRWVLALRQALVVVLVVALVVRRVPASPR